MQNNSWRLIENGSCKKFSEKAGLPNIPYTTATPIHNSVHYARRRRTLGANKLFQRSLKTIGFTFPPEA
ncbi:hypothetical protein DRJ19_05605 [Candidatus Woesearchaeota archaeon]|nr:MAG: hypothetical protein DRJ19_05605 [Candidatus Woesearchaeota archaeon]